MRREQFTSIEREKLRQTALEMPRRIHRTFYQVPGFEFPIIPAGGGYNGIWLEHNQDCLLLTELFPDSAWESMKIFLEFQMQNGLFPCAVTFNPTSVNFGQIQTVWPFARCAFEIWKKAKRNREDLRKIYDASRRYDQWLLKYRCHNGQGLVEMFCEYDTGHDNAPRVLDGGIGHQCPGIYAGNPPDLPCMPIIAPDLSSTRYQALVALAEMAVLLQKTEEAQIWTTKADDLKQNILRFLYDAEDEFFYDRSPQGFRKYRTEHITRLFLNRVVEQEMFDRIYSRYFESDREFLTPWPFPSVALSDPTRVQPPIFNCWGGNTQALTQLRALFWMDHYGKGEELEALMARMLRNVLEFPENNFPQEIDPFTGRSTSSRSHDYLPAMLFFLYSCRRLGIIKDFSFSK